MGIGDKIMWLAVNGPKTGVIEEKRGEWYLVRLPNKKYVIVAFSSIKKWKETSKYLHTSSQGS